MPKLRHCCVPGCFESGESIEPLHRFPNPELDRERFNTWLYAVGGDLIGRDNSHIFKYTFICHRHFEFKFLCRYSRISKIAIPTLNLPDLKVPTRYSFEDRRRPMYEIQNFVLNPPKPTDASDDLSMNAVTYQIYDEIGKYEPIPSTSKHSIYEENIDPITTGEDTFVEPLMCSELRTTEPLPSTSAIVKNIDPITTEEDSFVEPLMCSELRPTEPITSISAIKFAKGIYGTNTPRKTARKNIKRMFFNDAEIALRKEIIAAKVKLCKYKNKIKKQTAEIKSAKKLASNPAVLKTLENCSTVARLLMQIQWRENKKKSEGRRFSLQEKIAALTIMKQGPKAYRFLRKVFILPAPQTLIKLIQESNMQPGINKNVFSQLKKQGQKMTTREKLCVLLYDEISLKTNVTYRPRQGRIIGFVDTGDQRIPEYANHAQVFMIRGFINNYKQAVAYTFSASATKGPELAKQIKTVAGNLQEAGFTVVASICDQGSNNRQAIKLLQDETRGIYLRRGEEPKKKIILVNNQEIVPIYDPPHLLKGMRNNMLTKDLKFTQNGVEKIAKWSHLEILQKENPAFEGIRLIPKLTENHVNREKLNKMKVKFASQIFSRTVASNMGYLADKGLIPTECRDTASLLLFMDHLFDSLNGSFKKNRHAKPLLGPCTPFSIHHKTWSESIKVLKSMKFITNSGSQESVPSIANWVWTLEAVEVLLKKMNAEYGITSVWMRHLNQDPLENFFGAIRSHGCRNNNPTCEQFQAAFATLLINNINSVHAQGKNCEKDYCDALHALVVDNNDCKATSTSSIDVTKILTRKFKIEDKITDPQKLAPLQYLSGYFLKKVKERVFRNCHICNNILISKDTIEYIQYREYAGRRWLCSPSDEFIKLISDAQTIINQILKENLERIYLSDIIKTVLFTLCDFNFINCMQHRSKIIDFLINSIINFSIHLYCKNINKILTGRIENYDDEDAFQIKAKKMFYKCCKRKHK